MGHSVIRQTLDQELCVATPAIWTSFAVRAYPMRWRILASAIAGVLVLGALFFAGDTLRGWQPRSQLLVSLAAVFPVFLAWFSAGAIYWFHPEVGDLRVESPRVRAWSPARRAVSRWAASLVLVGLLLSAAIMLLVGVSAV